MWIYSYGLVEEISIFKKYSKAIYFTTTTIATVGYGG